MSLPDEQEFGEIPLGRFLSVRDSYAGAIADFQRFLQSNNFALSLSAVKAYFAHLSASTLAAGTRLLRRQAVKARLRAVMAGTDLNQQAHLELVLRSLDRGLQTKAPQMVRTGIPEERIVGQESSTSWWRAPPGVPRLSSGSCTTPAVAWRRCAVLG